MAGTSIPTESQMQTDKRWRRIGRTAVGLAVFAVLCAALLVINAIRLPSRQLSVASPAETQLDSEALAAILAEFLAVPSYSADDRSQMDRGRFQQLHEILERRFPEAHRVLEHETINGMSLLYRWPGRDESLEPILLMSHLDVVPIEEASHSEWRFPPPQATVADGLVWGRGALDVKCGVIGIMAAVERLVRDEVTPDRTVYLAFGHDEEVGGEDGNGEIARRFQEQGTRFAFVHDEGGAILDDVVPGAPRPVAFIAIAEKGVAHLQITARGAGGHGSMPGRSAIVQLAEAITRIEKHPLPIRLTEPTQTFLDFLAPELPLPQKVVVGNRWLFGGLIGWQFSSSSSTNAVVRSTLNITQVGTDSVSNQNATVAHATINVRLLPGDTAEMARDHVQSLTADLRLGNGEPAIVCEITRARSESVTSPIDCDEFRTLQQTIHEVFPDALVAAGLTSVSTDSSWYYGVTDKVYRFIPMRLKPEDLVRIHGVNERIGVANLAEISRFYEQLIRNATLGQASGVASARR
jgi:carboxypeptidase PM20D1